MIFIPPVKCFVKTKRGWQHKKHCKNEHNNAKLLLSSHYLGVIKYLTNVYHEVPNAPTTEIINYKPDTLSAVSIITT